jgi:deazaflavin-dependent oxidoreductase (nitroreductase family)
MPRFMRTVNRVVTNRLMAPMAGYVPPLALVHHVGRKSGRRYRTPVLAFPIESGTLTPLPYGTDTDWVLNLLADGGGALEALGRRTAVANPRVVTAEEGLAVAPAVLRPLLRLLSLPGFLLLDRAERSGHRPGKPAAARRRRVPPRGR